MSDDGLGRLNLAPVPVKPGLAIAADVLTEAQGWVLHGDPHYLRCRCGQAVITTGTLTVGALSTALLAHLMQRHGWTREGVHSGD